MNSKVGSHFCYFFRGVADSAKRGRMRLPAGTDARRAAKFAGERTEQDWKPAKTRVNEKISSKGLRD